MMNSRVSLEIACLYASLEIFIERPVQFFDCWWSLFKFGPFNILELKLVLYLEVSLFNRFLSLSLFPNLFWKTVKKKKRPSFLSWGLGKGNYTPALTPFWCSRQWLGTVILFLCRSLNYVVDKLILFKWFCSAGERDNMFLITDWKTRRKSNRE